MRANTFLFGAGNESGREKTKGGEDIVSIIKKFREKAKQEFRRRTLEKQGRGLTNAVHPDIMIHHEDLLRKNTLPQKAAGKGSAHKERHGRGKPEPAAGAVVTNGKNGVVQWSRSGIWKREKSWVRTACGEKCGFSPGAIPPPSSPP